jgi:hypothetical protein
MMKRLEDEGRIFQEKWKNVYFFSVVRDKVVYLIRSEVISVPKEHSLLCRCVTLHKDKFGVLGAKLREDELKNLKIYFSTAAEYINCCY